VSRAFALLQWVYDQYAVLLEQWFCTHERAAIFSE